MKFLKRQVSALVSQKSFQKGQLLVELILVMGLFALLLPALLTAFTASREGKAQQEQRQAATALLKETEVAVKAIKSSSWTTIANAQAGTEYYPSTSGSSWTLSSGSDEPVDGFTRSLTINNVSRDTNGAIVSSGGTVDPSTRQIVITVSWDEPTTSAVTSTLYLTRTENLTYTETTQAEFNTGTRTGTVTTNISGGEVVLASGGGGDWCSPNLSITAFDLPKNGVANAITAIEGRVFAGTGDNASGVSFANVNISNANPPVASSLGTFDGYKTNDIFGEANYAYFATDNNSKEIEIVNLSSTPYTEAGNFNAPGNGNGNSVYVTSTYGYMTSGNTFYNFRKVGSAATIDSNGVGLASTGNNIAVVGNYAYVATGGTTNQLQIIDISSPGNLTVTSSLSVAGQAGRDVYVNSSGTRAYLVTADSASQNEFFIINITNKSAPSVVGSYNTNGMSPKGVTVVTSNKAIAVGTGGSEYQVINIANESSPVGCGSLNIDTGVNGVSSVVEADGDAFSYIITGDTTTELKIIEGGPGGQYATSGTFESATYDAGSAISYNRFVASVSQPSQTTIQMQVAAAAPVSGSCPSASSSYTFVGPNGNSSAYFTPSGSTITGIIPFGTYSPSYVNPARCFRYKAWFTTTDVTQTAELYDIIINRSP